LSFIEKPDYEDPKDVDKDKLYEFLRDMEFNRLLSQAISFYGEPGRKDFNEKTLVKKNDKINTKTYKTISKEKQLDELIKKLDEKSVIAVDTETSSLNPQEADLVGVSLCYEASPLVKLDQITQLVSLHQCKPLGPFLCPHHS